MNKFQNPKSFSYEKCFEFLKEYSKQFDLNNNNIGDYLDQKLSYEWIWLLANLIFSLKDKNENSFWEFIKNEIKIFEKNSSDIKTCIKQNINYLKTAKIINVNNKKEITINDENILKSLLVLDNCFIFVAAYSSNYLNQLNIHDLVIKKIEESESANYDEFKNSNIKKDLNKLFQESIRKQSDKYESDKNLNRIFNKPCKYLWYYIKNCELKDLAYSKEIINNENEIKNILDKYNQNMQQTQEISNNQETLNDEEYILEINNILDENSIDENSIKKNINNKEVYGRDLKTSLIALKNANYLCEIDNNHYLFKRKHNNLNYTECHHLIPISKQDDFEYKLDVVENIVSLCPNCHREIHFGKNNKQLIEKLYNERKDKLKIRKLEITLENLIKYYN